MQMVLAYIKSVRIHSTVEVARLVGVHKLTLIRWLLNGQVKEPRRIKQGGVDIRLWTDGDLERIRKYKEAHYRKGRGRKRVKK
jgi:DNA-binding transcriptional MerR regulator